MREQPRDSWFAEAWRVLQNNPNDRAIRIDRTILEGLVHDAADVAIQLREARSKIGALVSLVNQQSGAEEKPPAVQEKNVDE